jgi:hypothetical protein
MNTKPTIHVTLQIKGIVAAGYGEAKAFAYQELYTNALLADVLAEMKLRNFLEFHDACRIAKECDGTYTVTVP